MRELTLVINDVKNNRARYIYANEVSKDTIERLEEILEQELLRGTKYQYIIRRVDIELGYAKTSIHRSVIEQMRKKEKEMEITKSNTLKKLERHYYRMIGKREALSEKEWKEIYLSNI